MTPTQISSAVSFLAALSVATERLVEIVKGSIPWLNQENKDPTKEGWRQAALHLLAAIAGIITTLLAAPAIQGTLPVQLSTYPGILALGLLASGGSGFWNSILTYVGAAKDIKKAQVPVAQVPPGQPQVAAPQAHQ
jgi:hypothetical protein